MREKRTDSMFIGFALFAMFFGAGNLIFPPQLGVLSGASWLSAFISYFIADAGLAILCVFAMINYEGHVREIVKPFKAAGTLLAILIALCIGPCIAIPRTGTTSFELALQPICGFEENATLALAIFSVVFFVIVFALTIRESAVIDIVGKILTPLLLIFLFILIVMGLCGDWSVLTVTSTETPVKDGVLNGYQTLDAMAAYMFADIIILSVFDRGYKKGKEANKITIRASIISCVLLFVVYGGLTYLGASVGGKWLEGVKDGSVDQAQILVNIVKEIMGESGVYVLAIVVLLACLTTAIGLTSAIAQFFDEISSDKIKYKYVVIAVCVVSAFLCNLGLAEIISIAAPILSFAYPLIIILLLMAFFEDKLTKTWAYWTTGLVTLIISACTVLCDLGLESMSWVYELPLANIGINWVIPAAVALVIGIIVPRKQKEA